MTTPTTNQMIDDIAAETIVVPIVGTTPLIMNRFTEKERRAMLEKNQGKKSLKEARDPVAEFEAAKYYMKDGERYGFPIGAFKKAFVGAARFYGRDVRMTELRQFVFFSGEPGPDGIQLAEIKGSSPVMREDVVRISSGTSMVRFRPCFEEWRTELKITYVKNSLDRGSVLSLLSAAGLGVGVGEWRPEKSGEFGTFKIDTTLDVQVVD